MTEMFLQRSKSAPLTLRGEGSTDDSTDATLSMMLQHTSRLQEVDIVEFRHEEWLTALLASPTPLLQKIKLYGYMWRPHTRFRFDTSAPLSTPSLQILDTVGWIFGLSPPFFSNLTQLSIRYYNDGHLNVEDRLTTIELFAALQGMPRLQDLRLSDAVDLEDTRPYNEGLIVLPVLSSLWLQVEEGTRGLVFLQYLNLPSIKQVTIDCWFPATPHDVTIVAPIAHALLPPHDPSLLQSTFTIDTLYPTRLIQTTAKLEIQGPRSKPLVALRMTMQGTWCLECEQPLRSFRPFPDPEVLYFNGIGHEEPSALLPFFRDLTRVRELQVERLVDITFALQDKPGDLQEDDVPPPYMLPSLKRISLFQWDRPKGSTKRRVVRIGKLLLDMKSLGAAVETLRVIRPRDYCATDEYNIMKEDFKHLFGIVDVVFLP